MVLKISFAIKWYFISLKIIAKSQIQILNLAFLVSKTTPSMVVFFGIIQFSDKYFIKMVEKEMAYTRIFLLLNSIFYFKISVLFS